MSILFVDSFDEILAKTGPAGLFTLNHDGDLCFDLVQTRYLRNQNTPPFVKKQCHCMLLDKQTRWPQYALITSLQLTVHSQQTEIVVFDDQASALRAVEQQKMLIMSVD